MPSALRFAPEIVSYLVGEMSFLRRLFKSGGEFVKSRLSLRPIESIRSPSILSVLNRRGVKTDEFERDRPSFFKAENIPGFGLARGLNKFGGLFTLSFCVSVSVTAAKFCRSTCCALRVSEKRAQKNRTNCYVKCSLVTTIRKLYFTVAVFTSGSLVSFQRIALYSYGDDVVHPPSGTKFMITNSEGERLCLQLIYLLRCDRLLCHTRGKSLQRNSLFSSLVLSVWL